MKREEEREEERDEERERGREREEEKEWVSKIPCSFFFFSAIYSHSSFVYVNGRTLTLEGKIFLKKIRKVLLLSTICFSPEESLQLVNKNLFNNSI